MGRDKQKSEKRLSELGLEVLERYGIWSQTDPIILGLSCDSKKVEHGFIFFAISGLHEHGAKYACDAVKRGAILIVTDLIGVKFLKEKSISLATVIVQNPRKSLSVCSARIFYKQPMNQVAITGTNGKTSVSVFVRQIWEELGLKAVNMPAIGKHFPGHGSVAPDSHVALPVDEREFDEIRSTDMVVFERLIERALLDGVMPAHVIYNQVCDKPAGFSTKWLQDILKQDLGFGGAVFSDDLSMHGASVAGSYVERAEAALEAGCDMVLACNNPQGAETILDGLETRFANLSNNDLQKQERIMALYDRVMPAGLKDKYDSGVELVKRLSER